jgi:membrane protease YdiL (CAAX protease family)
MAGRTLALFIVAFSVLSYFISLAAGLILYFSTSDGLAAAQRTVHELFIELFMVIVVPVPLNISLGALFVAIWGAFVVCMVLAWFDRGEFPNSIRGALSNSVSLAKTNFLFVMPLVGSALVYATIIISQFQETQGVQTGNLNFPTTNPYVILTEVSLAPLTEEFAFRITSIGIPLGILLLVLFRNDPRISGLKKKLWLVLLAMYSPERAKVSLGYRNIAAQGFPRGITRIEWLLILLTSLAFGLAHYLSGGGWEIGKVSTAFLAGFVFAIMYVAYGAYADILLHWFFNYYFDVLSKAQAVYGGLFNPLSSLSDLVNLVGGQLILVVFLLFTAYKLGGYFATKASGFSGGKPHLA